MPMSPLKVSVVSSAHAAKIGVAKALDRSDTSVRWDIPVEGSSCRCAWVTWTELGQRQQLQGAGSRRVAHDQVEVDSASTPTLDGGNEDVVNKDRA